MPQKSKKERDQGCGECASHEGVFKHSLRANFPLSDLRNNGDAAQQSENIYHSGLFVEHSDGQWHGQNRETLQGSVSVLLILNQGAKKKVSAEKIPQIAD